MRRYFFTSSSVSSCSRPSFTSFKISSGRTLQAAKTFLKYRQEDLEWILSDDGFLYRTNRSIQAEGSFEDSKRQDRNTFIFSENCLIFDILKYVFSSHENGLLKCTLFTKSQNELEISLKVNHRNNKNEATVSSFKRYTIKFVDRGC